METNVKLADAYYRLSNEEANAGESGSITNQRNIVRQYCSDNGIVLVREFADDGFTGSNFDRPGFKALLAHIKSGLVNMVITKDLSRLGRDMTESSNYAERFFPENGIHYIAISDNFDSESTNLMAPFQFAMNDVYLRDTSRKIKQVISFKRKKGEYCACPPFGYMKDSSNKTVLVPDPMTAPIVQLIFDLAVKGESAHAIAAILTQNGCITPLKYRVMYRDSFGDNGASRASDVWNHTTVKRILKNEVYLGHTILGKTKKVSVKSKKKVAVPKDEWSVTKNTHEPLVTQEQFDMVERYIGMHTKARAENEPCRQSIFNGIIFCACCGGAMCSAGTVYKGERIKYWYLSCNNIPDRSPKHCEHGARIKYSDLLETVRMDLNRVISLSDEDIEAITEAAVKSVRDKAELDISLPRTEFIEKRLVEIDKIIVKLYRDNACGIIEDERLANMVKALTAESKALKLNAAEIRDNRSGDEAVKAAYDDFFKLAREFTHIDTLTNEIVRTFIERIEVGEKILPPGYKVASHDIPYRQSVKIVYRFIGNIGENDMKYWNSDEDEVERQKRLA